MDKFIGKINGVEYTDRNEFYEALSKVKPQDVKSISLIENSSNDDPQDSNLKKESKNSNINRTVAMAEYDKSEALNTLIDIFGSFLNSLKGHNAPVKNKNVTEQKPVAEQNENYSIDDIIRRFTFPETTYEFTGGELDELELDKFDGLLARRAKEFSEVYWSDFDCDELTELREEFASRFSKTDNSIIKCIDNQKETDEKLAKYERLLEAFHDLGIESEENQEVYKKLQKDFDITDNRKNYYELLRHYYGELIKVIDAQY